MREYSLQMLHYGAAQPRCDWGMSHEEGIYTRLPQAEAARVLSSLVCLRARMRFEAGQGAEAVDDIVAGMILGRHSSLTGTNHHAAERLRHRTPDDRDARASTTQARPQDDPRPEEAPRRHPEAG